MLESHVNMRKAYNRGQNSLEQMSFALKEEAFHACEPLPSIFEDLPTPPLPALQCWLLEEGIFINSSMAFS